MSIKLAIKKLEWRLKNNEWTRRPYLGKSERPKAGVYTSGAEVRQKKKNELIEYNKKMAKDNITAAQKFKKRYT